MAKTKSCPMCFKPFDRITGRPTCNCSRRLERVSFLKTLAKGKRKFNMGSISKEDSEGAKKLDSDSKYF